MTPPSTRVKGMGSTIAKVVVALAYSNMGRAAEALPVFKKNWRSFLAQKDEKCRRTVFSMVWVAASHARLNPSAEALKLMQPAMQLRQEVFPPEDRPLPWQRPCSPPEHCGIRESGGKGQTLRGS